VNIPTDEVRIEWLILADGAQIANGKLFVLGGGWDVLNVNSGFPARHHLGLAAAFRVPWNATNQRHAFELLIVNDDSEETLVTVAGEFEVGRPPGIPNGTTQRSQIAAEMIVEIPSPGQYAVRVRLNGVDYPEQQVPFLVNERPLAAHRQGQPGQATP
jgi:hypothetical protein